MASGRPVAERTPAPGWLGLRMAAIPTRAIRPTVIAVAIRVGLLRTKASNRENAPTFNGGAGSGRRSQAWERATAGTGRDRLDRRVKGCDGADRLAGTALGGGAPWPGSARCAPTAPSLVRVAA